MFGTILMYVRPTNDLKLSKCCKICNKTSSLRLYTFGGSASQLVAQYGLTYSINIISFSAAFPDLPLSKSEQVAKFL